MIATSWAIFQDKRISSMNTKLMQLICLVIFLIAIYIASKGLNPLKKLATLAGTSMFVMSILFIILMMAAPAITNAHLNQIDWSFKTFMPTFDTKFFTNLAILVFAVGGCEKYHPMLIKWKIQKQDFQKV